jgi:hypothetical protein
MRPETESKPPPPFFSLLSQWNKKLISINDQKHAIMTVDQTKVVTGGRESIRIHSTYVFNGGLILMDAHHMPTGCGSWPAWWANGPNWPQCVTRAHGPWLSDQFN